MELRVSSDDDDVVDDATTNRLKRINSSPDQKVFKSRPWLSEKKKKKDIPNFTQRAEEVAKGLRNEINPVNCNRLSTWPWAVRNLIINRIFVRNSLADWAQSQVKYFKSSAWHSESQNKRLTSGFWYIQLSFHEKSQKIHLEIIYYRNFERNLP